MKNQIFSAKNKFLLPLLAGLVVVLIISGGYFYYHNEVRRISKEKYNELKAVADLKTSQIMQWRQQRIRDAKVFAESPFVRRNTERWLSSKNNSLRTDILERMALTKYYYGYENIFLLSPGGEILLSFDTALQKIDSVTISFCKSTAGSRKAVFSDFYYCSVHKRIHFDILAPIMDEKKSVISVLVLRVDPNDYLYPLIQSWPTPSKSSETILLRKEGENVLYLNDLKFQKNTAMNLRLPLTMKYPPAVQAALGFTGIFSGKDYRDIDVLAYIRPVPGTPWFMVAKVNKDEIFSELYYRTGVIIVFTLVILLSFAIGMAWLYSNRQKNIYRELLKTGTLLQESQEEFKATLYSIGDAVITTDINGRVRNMNPVAEQLTGWKEGNAGGKPLEEVFTIINEETRNKVESPVHRVLREGLVVGLANHSLLISKEGKEIPIADSGAPIWGKKNKISGVVLVFRDQTEQRRAAEETARAKVYLESSLASIPDGVLLLDRHAKFTYVNPVFLKWLDRKPEDFVGRTVREVSPPFLTAETTKIIAERATRRVTTGEPIAGAEVELIGSGGRVIPISYSAAGIRNEKGDILGEVVFIKDITEHKRAEAALRESESKFKRLYDSNIIGVIFWDTDGNITKANNEFLRMVGYTEDEVFSGKVRWRDMTPPEYAPLDEKALKEMAETGVSTPFEKEYIHKDGSRVPILLGAAIFKEQKDVGICFIQDITERKQAEEALRKSLEDLKRSNEELEQFAYVASHDLQEPLRMISSFTQLLSKRYTDKLDKDANEFINYVVDGANRMQQLIQDLLSYSRVTTRGNPLKNTDTHQALGEAISNLQVSIKETGAIITNDDLPEITADYTQIVQLFQNLIGNAIKFHGRESPRIHFSAVSEDNEWIFSVRDNGIGIAPEYFERIFVIFQRLHSGNQYLGTGIGLAICNRIVQRHGGRIWVESEPGKGSVFYFTLKHKELNHVSKNQTN